MTYLKQNLFHSRMIRPVVGGGGPTCLKPIEGVIPQGDEVTLRTQYCRRTWVPLVAKGGSSVFVSICVHLWFMFINGHPFSLE